MLTDASGQQSTVDANKRDKVVVTPQILSYYSELKMWTVDKKLGALCGLCMTSERSIVVATQLKRLRPCSVGWKILFFSASRTYCKYKTKF